MPNVLKKACKCAICGEPMRVGEAFAWRHGSRDVPTYALGAGSGALKRVATISPQHAFDCFAAKVAASISAEKLAGIEAACAIARKYGESEEEIAKYRQKMLDE